MMIFLGAMMLGCFDVLRCFEWQTGRGADLMIVLPKHRKFRNRCTGLDLLQDFKDIDNSK
jgi:hypothetical protein